jgi:UDP-N-acetylglucosamine--N-acetylmuramyl-(pentapeptide) pyrophosphoryl-undecaprenol N-acetylglucosamine transferase
MKDFCAVFAGGGTGGHLFPALVIADRLSERLSPECDTRIIFVGTRRGIEYGMRDRLGYRLELINIRAIARSFSLRNLAFPFVLIGAILKSLRLLRRYNPDIVVGTGGYVMGPVLLAAYLSKYRRVIQEQNSYPGLATRKLSGLVDRVFVGFADAKRYLSRKCIVIESGNPIRGAIGTISKDEARRFFELDADEKVILVLGGSQGAARINRNIVAHLDRLPEGCRLVWQTGERDYGEVTARAGGRVGGRALFPFIKETEMAYGAADFVIARAGALTMTEIARAGLPSILIPYPFATGDHQRKNAESFVRAGAAVTVDDADLDSVDLVGRAWELMQTGRGGEMAAASRDIGKRGSRPAADLIVDEILRISGAKEE